MPLPETFSALEALQPFLVKVQRERRTEAVFRLTDAAAELSTAQLHGALDLLLPWVQRSARHICRERSFIAVRCRLGYRDGLRLADAWLAAAPHALTARERTALDAALGLAREAQSRYALPSDQLRFLISALASRVRYATALPGRAACAVLVSGVTALTEGQANCQGFSDALYLLGTLSGIPMGYQCGWNPRGPHLWNLAQLDGRWFAVDATPSAADHEAALPVLLTRQDCLLRGLTWPSWAQTAAIATHP